jgi:hypothetical protein
LETTIRVAQNIALAISVATPRVEAHAIFGLKIAVGRYYQAVRDLCCGFFAGMELPVDAKLIDIDTDGLGKPMDATLNDLHGDLR